MARFQLWTLLDPEFISLEDSSFFFFFFLFILLLFPFFHLRHS